MNKKLSATWNDMLNFSNTNEAFAFIKRLKYLSGNKTGVRPERLSSVHVRVVTAATGSHVVVAQEIRIPASPLTLTQDTAINFKHTIVQQLVEDGCRRHIYIKGYLTKKSHEQQ